MKRALALAYGLLAYLLFFVTFLYAVFFVGGLGVPLTVDAGRSAPLGTAIVIDALLLSAFAVQHSVMARQGFKRRWTKIVSGPVERSTYVVAASLVLALLLWQWRPIPQVIWDLRGTMAEPLLVVLFWAGWATVFVSTFLINHFELFGLSQVWAFFRGHEFRGPAFKTPVLYRMVRHPIYLGFTVAFWAAPHMTAGHLLFAVATTGYMLVGIHFEERDLTRIHGQAYRAYRERVPMLIPLPKGAKGKAGGSNAEESA